MKPKGSINQTNQISLFSDGASSGNPGPGGYGVILVSGNQVIEIGGGAPETTNNRMEMMGVIEGLRYISRQAMPFDEVAVYTDSLYVLHGITGWVFGWKKRGWKTSEGKDVANRDLWDVFSQITGKPPFLKKIVWNYYPGHKGVPANERADAIAVSFSKGRYVDLYRGPLLKYDIPVYDLPEDTSVPEFKPREARGAAGEAKVPVFYLSLVDGKLERSETWKECEAKVKGRPGAKFKKAKDEAEAQAILKSWNVTWDSKPKG
jgi:ribonuclease HI